MACRDEGQDLLLTEGKELLQGPLQLEMQLLDQLEDIDRKVHIRRGRVGHGLVWERLLITHVAGEAFGIIQPSDFCTLSTPW
eukprot:CAMPEP_0179171138 /NCGR_PEP_ID=MMETSP0796-20121207/84347_1 /TAXON_ID=73915 /ORGANISM="Pyrodinium bahamense, Strain pbaha01" /LENGTH=81 /DNA_ID=CAMNT_0020874183 /DNA_START=178 /DNA_END=423 /DNA_ORIENTATION=-